MKEYHVLNLGAGVQSTCLYLLEFQQWLPLLFDAAVFADTGEEPAAVYKHLEWLKTVGGAPIITEGRPVRLGDQLKKGMNATSQRFVSIPAFTAPDELVREEGWKEGILRRQCTQEYKIRMVRKAIREQIVGLRYKQHFPKDVIVYQYFGITTDERSRTKRALPEPWSRPVYPFIDMDWSRQDCIDWLKRKGGVPHEVPRSACTFCPYRKNEEWAKLKATDPEGWARAVEIDEALRTEGTVANRNMNQKIYLHRTCLPLIQIDFGAAPDLDRPMENECQGMCGV